MQSLPGPSKAELDNKSLSLLQMLNPNVLADPQTLYRPLREQDPVHWDPYIHAWVVTSYAEVLTVLTNCSSERTPLLEDLNKLGLGFMKPFAEIMRKQMLFMDPPAHTRLRGLCAVAFTPRKIEALRGMIQSIADTLIDKVISAGEMDVVADFAVPLPAILTARLMGVPSEDHLQLGRWVIDLAEFHGNFQLHPDRVHEVIKSLIQMRSYLLDQMEQLRKNPNEGLISSLITSEIDGERLTDEEVMGSTIATVVGGHETTTNLIASGLLTLLRDPVSLAQFRDNPGIVGSAIEELLRFESPVQHTARIVPDEMQLGDKTLKKGSKVIAVLAAANRDSKRFHNPDQLDLLRTDNRHLSFGWGAHFCFGAPLARMEAQIAFNTLLRRLPKPVMITEACEWKENAGLRGLTTLLVGFSQSPKFSG